MAFAPIMRTNTAPIFPSANSNLTAISNPAIGGAPTRTSQLSGTTAYGSSTTSLPAMALPPVPAQTSPTPVNGGPVTATSNIINQKADASRSLFQICMALKQRFAKVPDFDEYLGQLERDAAGGDYDPVESVWRLLRTGYPLLVIYNALQPEKPLKVEEPNANEQRRCKVAIFKFVQACMTSLNMPSSDCFVISDLMGDDTTGFVKVTQVINNVLDIAAGRGLLLDVQPFGEVDAGVKPTSKMSYRDYIVREMVETERKYVQDLENLYDLKKTLEERGVIPGDTIHQVFMNMNAILDFQRRFLIRVETTNSISPARQEWGAPFAQFEENFAIYLPFIANQRKAAQIAQSVFDKIKSAEHPVAVDFNTLDGFLLKPMQRLVKYPLLLKDLLKKTEDDFIKADLTAGIEAAERVLKSANDAVDRDLLDEALEDLVSRVDDWKSHRVEQFGKLLLHGVYTVVTGKSEQEKDYEIYLFECILLCCKEATPNKSKDKKDKTRSTGPKPRNKSVKLQLKGRIFMTNVTEVLSFSKPGSYTVQIFWKGDPGVESFTIKFSNEEMMKKWGAGLVQQKKENNPTSSQTPEQAPMDFAWNRTQNLENPWIKQQQEEEEDEVEYPAQAPPGQYNGPQSTGGVMTRNASSTSLRARSATGDSSSSLVGMTSMQSMNRAAPPRFPPGTAPAPLSLQTAMPAGQQSPGPRGGDSYFSPVAESPVSSRTSTTSGVFQSAYPFPKTTTPQPMMWGEDNNRYTAPAMARAPSRDGMGGAQGAYGVGAGVVPGRNPRGPSLPVMGSAQSQQQAAAAAAQQQRSRSYSTPDINGQPQLRRAVTSTGLPPQGVPAVPGIPAHLHPSHPSHDGTVPRSNTGSPRLNENLPMRSNTQSPGMQRERLMQQQQASGQYGATMVQFPAQPLYSRQTMSGVAPGAAGPAPMQTMQTMPVEGRTVSPPLGTSTLIQPMAPVTGGASSAAGMGTVSMGSMGGAMGGELPPMPTQLKVKVNCDSGTYFTLVVAINISYQTLIDRIDAKLARFTSSSIAKGNLRLRYRDEDGDFVSIESDDDIQIAFLEWREGIRNMYQGGVGEIELFCMGETT